MPEYNNLNTSEFNLASLLCKSESASTPVTASQQHTVTKITFTPTTSEVKVKYKYGTSGWTWHGHSICITKPIMVSETYYVDVCDSVGDKYRFGFNGQEKVNEISGIGNHNTAEFWEYDTRLGRRWNLDPVYKHNLSNYSVLSNSPLWKIDPDGDDDYQIDKKGNVNKIKEDPKSKKHTIYNSDKSKSINVNLNFFDEKNSMEFSYLPSKKYTIFAGKDINEMENTYKFFTENSEVEWEFSIFEVNNLKISFVASSHSENEVGTNVPYYFLIGHKNSKLLYYSHSHPPEYDPKNYHYPAYPSGFNHELMVDETSPGGDRANYFYYQKYFRDRIPEMFHIYIPRNPKILIKYNHIEVKRDLKSNQKPSKHDTHKTK